jgi:hypothetical protein
MARIDQVESANPNAETERLAALVQELQEECDKLRQALAQAQSERDGYRKAIYEHARAAREFVDVDIDSLKAVSAGPVETID